MFDGCYVWLGLSVRKESIPETLKRIDQWVLWRAVRHEATAEKPARTEKVPYQGNGKKASSKDPGTWTDFEDAVAHLEDEEEDYSGVGFAVRKSNGILVLDFDHVRNGETGEIDPYILGAVQYLGSYAEISPSGTGIRIIGYGTLDKAITSKVLQGWVDGRYVTITGHHLPGLPTDLKQIDAVKLGEIVEHYADAAKASAQPGGGAAQGFLPPRQIDAAQCLEIRQALGYIDPDESYDTWLQIGMALHSANASNAFGLWNEWSQGGPKYDSKAIRAKWRSFTDKPNGVGLSSIFAMAQQRGWVNPASRAAQAFEAVTGVSYEEANRRKPEPQLLPEIKAETRAFPVPGLDEVFGWVESLSSVAYPAITQQAVLAIVSAAVSRTYVTPQGDPLSLYLGCCGRSVGELRYVHHAVSAAMSSAGLRRMVRATRMTSPATIYKSLLRSPSTMYLSDDYGGVAAFSKRQPSGLQEHALSLISSLYDGKTIQLDGPEDAGLRSGSAQVSDEQPVIYAPALSVLALIGTDQLATLMRQSETGRGALQQMLFAIGDERSIIEHDPIDVAPPTWLPGYLRTVRRVPHPEQGVDLNLADIFSAVSGLAPTQVVVPFDAALKPTYDELDSLSEDRRVRSLLLAARGIVRRIAAGLAAWGSPDAPVVTRGILDWATAYVCDRMRETVEQFEILHSVDGKSSVYDQVLAKIAESRTDGVSEGDLAAVCWAYRNLSGKQRGELIETMLQDRMVMQITRKPKTGRPSKRLVAARFVKTQEEGEA